jgi:hypothetical protein
MMTLNFKVLVSLNSFACFEHFLLKGLIEAYFFNPQLVLYLVSEN